MITSTNVTRKLFNIQEYHRLIELGFLTENERIELIRGELIQMTAKGTPHSSCTSSVVNELVVLLYNQAIVRGQEPISLPPNNEPEPDVVIARYRADRYSSKHPSVEDIILVAEVFDSTLKYDTQEKLTLYAEYKIANYWIFNLVANCLEVYTQPFQDLQGNFNYANKQIYLPNAIVNIPQFPDISLNLSLIFPLIS
ncbi:Uma2 family endonuclease [Nostoc sp. 2RC]|uniref:Uma2 family endonuclease n=1 Tax=Nostoc sp. 2RC TaxID=2485484 RepID=UPI0016250436|nr:Uma2 family endonuclease [Nostoc sp. 2RC]MBC1241466.1 Uma2 family endonuclease [Nostoc sp. 2RC]